ncbi:hypothetical protein DFH06DRAFT_1137761 [Mycena polygramma]|nr:hypothetical protein DFH06DRAFT_1137761 [Mycena polygramma]
MYDIFGKLTVVSGTQVVQWLKLYLTIYQSELQRALLCYKLAGVDIQRPAPREVMGTHLRLIAGVAFFSPLLFVGQLDLTALPALKMAVESYCNIHVDLWRADSTACQVAAVRCNREKQNGAAQADHTALPRLAVESNCKTPIE